MAERMYDLGYRALLLLIVDRIYLLCVGDVVDLSS